MAMGLDYLGEKPLATHPSQLRCLVDPPTRIWCDLIETESLVLLTLKACLAAEALTPIKLEFWRFNSTGCAKIFDPRKRTGVQGGALLDKAPHDLSLTWAILGADHIAGFSVRGADVSEVMPFSLDPSDTSFLGSDGRPVAGLLSGMTNAEEGLGVADAAASMTVDFDMAAPSGPNVVPAAYHVSWIGVPNSEAALHAVMGALYQPSEWLHSEFTIVDPEASAFESRAYIAEEVRIAVVKCVDPSGAPVDFVCNFLTRDDIQPWLDIVRAGRRTRIELLPRRFGHNSLARLLEGAVREKLGGSPASLIGPGITRQVHEIIFDARWRAFERPRETRAEAQRSRLTLTSRLVTPEPFESASWVM